MKHDLGFGIKFFQEEEHKKMFEEGQIFSNAISYYRKQEQELGNGRGDSNEGILSLRLRVKPRVTLETEKGQSINGVHTKISVPILEEQHIFSFIYLEREWYEIDGEKIHFKMPNSVSCYFFENYGKFYSLFSIDTLIYRLNKTILEGGLAYITHFKIEYVDDEFLTSEERFVDLNNMMDQIEELENNYEEEKPVFDELCKKYMGVKSQKYSMEHEMRIVLGVYSPESSTIQI